jgi:hypothetical protein
MKDVAYPQDIVDWQAWIIDTLGIDINQAKSLLDENKFPFDRLIEAWKRKFSPENGYSPNFIPALVRNKMRFVRWVYLRNPEPNWTESDSEQQ